MFYPAHTPRVSARPERGIALAVVLVVMVILTVLGIVLLMQTDSNQFMARNSKQTAICRQAAEAAARQGIALAAAAYAAGSGSFNSILSGTCATCPTTSAQLDLGAVVDRPGNPMAGLGNLGSPASAQTAIFSGAGAGDASTVYIRVYVRNNPDEPAYVAGPAVPPALPVPLLRPLITGLGAGATPGLLDADSDLRLVVVGEALMTDSGAMPTAGNANVRTRKMVAVTIRMPGAGILGFCADPHNQNTSYCVK